MKASVDVLVIGAGPFGLAVAAQAGALGIDHLVVGEPMGFWRAHMPVGMLLRSGLDWHLDPLGEYTMERFIAEQGLTARAVEPLTREFYLDYVDWFKDRREISPEPVMVERLDRDSSGSARFVATLEDGRTIRARRVVLALGMGPFAHVPDELAAIVPEGRGTHTCDAVDFAPLAGRRCLILGGRQSAFEMGRPDPRSRSDSGPRGSPARVTGVRGGRLDVGPTAGRGYGHQLRLVPLAWG